MSKKETKHDEETPTKPGVAHKHVAPPKHVEGPRCVVCGNEVFGQQCTVDGWPVGVPVPTTA